MCILHFDVLFNLNTLSIHTMSLKDQALEVWLSPFGYEQLYDTLEGIYYKFVRGWQQRDSI